MSKSGIEYVTDYWNPVTGCLNDEATCTVSKDCWARGIVKRFPDHYPDGFKPAFHSQRLDEPLHLKGSRRIFTVNMGDLFGEFIPTEWIMKIEEVIRKCPQHRFLLLTKNPLKMTDYFKGINKTIPDNVWLGATITMNSEIHRITDLPPSEKGGHRFISWEPLLESNTIDQTSIIYAISGNRKSDWWIIGAQSNPTIFPKWEVFETLYRIAKVHRIPLFIKNNLKPYLIKKEANGMFEQTFPEGY